MYSVDIYRLGKTVFCTSNISILLVIQRFMKRRVMLALFVLRGTAAAAFRAYLVLFFDARSMNGLPAIWKIGHGGGCMWGVLLDRPYGCLQMWSCSVVLLGDEGRKEPLPTRRMGVCLRHLILCDVCPRLEQSESEAIALVWCCGSTLIRIYQMWLKHWHCYRVMKVVFWVLRGVFIILNLI